MEERESGGDVNHRGKFFYFLLRGIPVKSAWQVRHNGRERRGGGE